MLLFSNMEKPLEFISMTITRILKHLYANKISVQWTMLMNMYFTWNEWFQEMLFTILCSFKSQFSLLKHLKKRWEKIRSKRNERKKLIMRSWEKQHPNLIIISVIIIINWKQSNFKFILVVERTRDSCNEQSCHSNPRR